MVRCLIHHFSRGHLNQLISLLNRPSLPFFFQGLSIASVQGSDKCLVLATDTSSEKAQDVGEFMRLGGNRNVTMTSDQWSFHTMPSDIEDTSFIDPRAHEYCSGGYRWTAMGQGMPGRPDKGGKG